MLHREKKQGLGRAYLHAFRWALEHQYQYVIEMDADFSHDPRYLPGLIDTAVNGADMAKQQLALMLAAGTGAALFAASAFILGRREVEQ